LAAHTKTAEDRVVFGLAALIRFATPDSNYCIVCEADRTIERYGAPRIARPAEQLVFIAVHEGNSGEGGNQFQKDGWGRLGKFDGAGSGALPSGAYEES
jgi:hypothetical protein